MFKYCASDWPSVAVQCSPSWEHPSHGCVVLRMSSEPAWFRWAPSPGHSLVLHTPHARPYHRCHLWHLAQVHNSSHETLKTRLINSFIIIHTLNTYQCFVEKSSGVFLSVLDSPFVETWVYSWLSGVCYVTVCVSCLTLLSQCLIFVCFLEV